MLLYKVQLNSTWVFIARFLMEFNLLIFWYKHLWSKKGQQLYVIRIKLYLFITVPKYLTCKLKSCKSSVFKIGLLHGIEHSKFLLWNESKQVLFKNKLEQEVENRIYSYFKCSAVLFLSTVHLLHSNCLGRFWQFFIFR